MIPYFPQPEWTLGPFHVHAFGITSAAALLLGYGVILRRARSHGIDPVDAGRIAVFAVLGSLLAGIAWAGGAGVAGSGVALGAGATLFFLARGRHFWGILDRFSYAFCGALAVARFGCFLAHDHIGLPTASWLGVNFPGGGRFDLGLLHCLSAALAFGALHLAERLRIPAGLEFGLAAALLGFARLIILRLGTATTGDWVVASLATCAGLVIIGLRSSIRLRASSQGVSAPQPAAWN